MLSDHAEEVWHVQFSHNGRWLASASKDATAILWEVTPQRQLVRRHTLRGHTGALTFCCWNPDDMLLATCSLDSLVKLWDVQLGICVRTIDHHQGAATTAAWMPGGPPLPSLLLKHAPRHHYMPASQRRRPEAAAHFF